MKVTEGIRDARLQARNNSAVSRIRFGDQKSEDLSDSTAIRQLTGALLLLDNTVRPSIAFAVDYLSGFIQKSTVNLWKTGKHVLRYLSWTKKYCVVFNADGEGAIRGYNDASWGGERPTLKSITGTVLTCSEGAICWRSKQQAIVAQNSNKSKLGSVLILC